MPRWKAETAQLAVQLRHDLRDGWRGNFVTKELMGGRAIALSPDTDSVSRGGGVRYTSLTTTISHDNNNHRTSKHASTSWRSDGSPSCLGGSSHGWGPGQNPQYTRAHFGGEDVGCSLALQHTTMSPRKRNTITTLLNGKKIERVIIVRVRLILATCLIDFLV